MIYPILNINITGGYTSSHTALDLGWTNTPNEELLACEDGVVESVYTITTGGNTILINYENGYKSYFMHCSNIIAKEGDRVSKKQLVAYMGMTGTEVTGPHCHFILTLNGERVNPIDHCYIEDWQNVSEKTKQYNVKYKEELVVEDVQNDIEENKEENKEEEPKQESLIEEGIEEIEEILEEPKKRKTIIKFIIDFIGTLISFLFKKIKG